MTPTADGVPPTAPHALRPRPSARRSCRSPGTRSTASCRTGRWTASIVDHVEATDLTTLGLFSVTHRRDGELDDGQNGYRAITGDIGRRLIRAAQDRGTRVELVYTSFGPGKNRQFYTEPEAQARWIEVLVDLVDELGLDGVNVDVERLPVEHVLDFGAFVGRLREALRARMPDAQVSVATQANELGAGMAAAAAANGADRIFLMGYDYHWAGSEPGASAPIDRLDGERAGPRLVARPVRGAGRAGRADDPGPAAVRHDVAGRRAGRRLAVDRSWRHVGAAAEPRGVRRPVVRADAGARRERRVLCRADARDGVGVDRGVPRSRHRRAAVGVTRLVGLAAAPRPNRPAGTPSTTTLPGVSPRSSPWPTSAAWPVPASGRSATNAACPATRS